MALKGGNHVLRQLKKQLNGIEKRERRGVWKAIALVEREAKKQTPVDTGNLIGSYERNVFYRHGKIKGLITVGAEYAVSVHEKNKRYRKPGAKWKYLEDPLKENAGQIFSILKEAGIIT